LSLHQKIIYKALETVELKELVSVFNNCFENYYVPIFFSEENLNVKLNTEDINLNLSVGAFHNENLVGFILHGVRNINGEWAAYNAGTGVLNEYRGQKLTFQMYHFILPKLKAVGVKSILLEVITENKRAQKVYTELGFMVSRELTCYKYKPGNSIAFPIKTGFHVINDDNVDITGIYGMCSTKPAWQNSIDSCGNLLQRKIYLIKKTDKEIISALVFNPASKRIVFIATQNKYRRRKYASIVLYHVLTLMKSEITVINISRNDSATIKLLEQFGFKEYLTQIEMQKNITD
jgi:ribosomal protein S18 acetylase RimI-like enzyme